MKLRKLKSTNEASDRDMLNYIFATQLQIIRKLDFLENRIAEGKIRTHSLATKEMINNVDSSFDRINEFLELDDFEKGELYF